MERLQQTITELNDKLKNENKTPESWMKNLSSFMNVSKTLRHIRLC